MKICVVCASRSNPDGFSRMCRSVEQTSSATVRGYVDEDQMNDYPPGYGPRDEHTLLKYTWHAGPRIGPAKAINRLVEWNPEFDVYCAATDDCEFLTPGWDEWVTKTVDTFPGRIGAISPYYGPENMGFPCVTREWIEAVGWFAHPRAYHFCWDTVIELLGEATKISYAPESKFSIRHPNHTSSNLKDHFERDCKSFLFWCVKERREAISRLRQAMVVIPV